MTLRRRMLALLPATALLTALAGVPAAAPAAAAPDLPCRPTAAHPEPVVLVHGTFANGTNSWQYIGNALRANGYCVFTLEYGGRPGSPFGGLAPVKESAQQLATFVDAVLAKTGASKVDLVGHSQGGMMPRWYIDRLGGADKVDDLVGLSSSNHGTTFNGLFTLAKQFPGGTETLLAGCPACRDQEVGSPFMQELNGGGDNLSPSVTYTVIQTRFDEVVTPYTSAFLDGATNIELQDVCPTHPTDHLGVLYDPAVVTLTLNALDPGRPQRVFC